MKVKRKFSSLLLLTLLVGLLVACGDSGAPTPAASTNGATSPTTNTSGSGSGSTTTSGGNATSVIKSSSAALAALKDYQANLDLSFTGQGAGDLSLEVLLKGSLAGQDDGGSLPQFKGTVTKSTLSTLPIGTVAILGKTTLIYDPVQKVVLKGSEGSASSEVYNLFIGSQTKIITLFSTDLAVPTLVGDEKVGSYNTSKLTFVPKGNLAGSSAFGKNAKGTVWIDKDSNLPVQLDYSEDGGGMKWTASNVQVNKGLEDSKLAFQPPTDAKVLDTSQFGKGSTVASLDEAKDKAGFAFPTTSYLPADLPKTPSNIGVQTTPLGNLILVDYSVKTPATNVTPFPSVKGKDPVQNSKGISISALKSAVNLPSNIPSNATISEVTVQGQKGTLADLGTTSAILTFSKDGIYYTITGTGYGKDEVQKIAEGLK